MKGMSVYDDDGGLYSAGSYEGVAAPVAAVAAPVVAPETSAVEVIPAGGPVPSNLPASAGPSLPFGLAILGVCAVAVIWAASLDEGKQ